MLKPGEKLDRYTVEALLGVGGMGCVYQAQDERLGRRVALKVLADDSTGDQDRAEASARLLREARAAASLDHPNAIHIYDVGEASGMPYIAMELVIGRTLRSYVGEPDVPVRQRLVWLLAVAHALAAAHDAHLVHRDVKPENVIVRSDGRVKVLDFGIARRSAVPTDPSAPTEISALGTLTAKGVPVGTPTYMAPEQIRSEPLDGRTDQFAWSVLAWELLTGRVPWKSQDALGLVAAILTQPAEGLRATVPEVPAEVEAAVLRGLSKAPADRFDSMHDIVRVLEKHVALAITPSIPPPESPKPERPAPTSGRRYSNEEIREIFQRALEQKHETGIGSAELVEAAREVGIDERAVRTAIRELDAAEPATGTPTVRNYEKQRLLRALVISGVTTVVLLSMYFRSGKGVFLLAILIMAATVALRYIRYAIPAAAPPERKRLRLGQEIEREVQEGVSALLTAAKQRMRVAGVARAPAPRVRVAPGRGEPAPDEVDEHPPEATPEARRRIR